jgi:hypothetical protein
MAKPIDVTQYIEPNAVIQEEERIVQHLSAAIRYDLKCLLATMRIAGFKAPGLILPLGSLWTDLRDAKALRY